jgi:hypothetical protein
VPLKITYLLAPNAMLADNHILVPRLTLNTAPPRKLGKRALPPRGAPAGVSLARKRRVEEKHANGEPVDAAANGEHDAAANGAEEEPAEGEKYLAFGAG